MGDLVLTDLHKRFGETPVLTGLNLSVPAGSFTAILGPSGVGKTTLLRLLAGFDRPDRGEISIGGRIVCGPSTHVRPEDRRIGYVPQEGSLFPHLTVAGNVTFGLARADRPGAVGDLLGLVGLEGLERRYPHQLSGGQQQRVALARALAIKPELVLLDEPFASLDASLRADIRDEVRRILTETKTTTLLVTHNQDEALAAADLVAVLRDGVIIQHASPRELYSGPADGRLAQFVGDANLLAGVLERDVVETPLGRLDARCRGDSPSGRCNVTVLIRPEQIVLWAGSDADRSGPIGRVLRSGYHGHDTVLHVQLESEPGGPVLLARTPGATQLVPGERCGVSATGPVLVWPATA